MRQSNSSNSLQRDFNRLQSRIEVMESRQKTCQSKSKFDSIGYSQLDNKENNQQVNSKYSYGAKYQRRQQSQQQQQLQKIEQPKIDDKKKLSVIFKFYASFGDRTNVDYLKSNKIHKLIADAQLKNINGLDTQSIDLLFVKANKNRPNMDFENFYYFLELLSDFIFGEGEFEQLLHNHLSPLYENIITSTDLGDEENKIQQNIDLVCVRLLQVLANPLTAIYNKYFPPHFKAFNIRDQQEDFKIKSQTKSHLFQFLKDFELCPQIITKGSACLLYDSILEDMNLPDIAPKNLKQKLDLNQFCCYLAKLAMISFQNFDEKDNSSIKPLQKLAYLLERMELSSGFLQLDVPNSQCKNWKLKVPEEVIEIILHDPKNAFQYLNSSTQRIKINQLKDEEFEEPTIRVYTAPSKQQSRHSTSSGITSKQYEHQAQFLFQQYYQELYNLYRQYAGINNQTGQENELVGSKWLKLLKDANLISNSCIDQQHQFTIQHSEVDIIFARACQVQNKGSVGRRAKQTMNFLQFLKGLQYVAKDPQQLEAIIKTDLIKLIGNSSENRIRDLLGVLMQILKDKEIVEFLGLLHKSIMIYYKSYSNQKNLMNFDQFQKFYKDFQIFPDLLTKNKIISIFQILSKLYEQNGDTKGKSGVIDQHMFVESLALAALDIQYNDVQQVPQIQKICFLIERINQSDGPKIVQKSLGHTKCPTGQDWDLLYFIRKRFAWLFEAQEEDEYNSYYQ